MESIHICQPKVDFFKLSVRRCPTCRKRRRMLVEHFAWYGFTVTCLTCGDEWQDGERCMRPCERGWRPKAVARAKARLKELREMRFDPAGGIIL